MVVHRSGMCAASRPKNWIDCCLGWLIACATAVALVVGTALAIVWLSTHHAPGAQVEMTP